MINLLWWLIATAGLVTTTQVTPEVPHVLSGKQLAFAMTFFPPNQTTSVLLYIEELRVSQYFPHVFKF